MVDVSFKIFMQGEWLVLNEHCKECIIWGIYFAFTTDKHGLWTLRYNGWKVIQASLLPCCVFPKPLDDFEVIDILFLKIEFIACLLLLLRCVVHSFGVRYADRQACICTNLCSCCGCSIYLVFRPINPVNCMIVSVMSHPCEKKSGNIRPYSSSMFLKKTK